MPRRSKSRWFAIGLSALALIGCQPAEIGTVGPETRSDGPLDEPSPTKGKGSKGKAAPEPVTRETRK